MILITHLIYPENENILYMYNCWDDISSFSGEAGPYHLLGRKIWRDCPELPSFHVLIR
jgi:hypothetical protein|tara:strand:+ start:77 stop:250 length:174 start_codon:yes stop_codon:yes gene_type:complete